MISKKHRANFCKVTWKYFDPFRFYMTYSFDKVKRRHVRNGDGVINRAALKSQLIQELYSHYRLQKV